MKVDNCITNTHIQENGYETHKSKIGKAKFVLMQSECYATDSATNKSPMNGYFCHRLRKKLYSLSRIQKKTFF